MANKLETKVDAMYNMLSAICTSLGLTVADPASEKAQHAAHAHDYWNKQSMNTERSLSSSRKAQAFGSDLGDDEEEEVEGGDGANTGSGDDGKTEPDAGGGAGTSTGTEVGAGAEKPKSQSSAKANKGKNKRKR